MGVTLEILAREIGARLVGDGSIIIDGVASLELAKSGQLAFLSNPKYSAQLLATEAGAVLISEKDAAKRKGAALISANPYLDFARLTAKYFAPRRIPDLGIHPTAVVSDGAAIAPDARVGALCIVEDGAQVGAGCVLYPGVYVGHGVSLGANCLLYPYVALMEGVRIGQRVIIHAGSVLGSDGFGFAPNPPEGYVKAPQVGGVRVEDDVEIQANVCIDRGALGDTVIKKGAKLDNLVHIAHNVIVGEHSALAGQTAVAGSSELGSWVTMAGQSAITGHVKIGDQSIVTGQAGVGKDLPAKSMVSGTPAQPTLEHHRGLAELVKLGELKKRVKELERRLAELDSKGGA